jgi:TRAP-type C4-dicarboxylate transport system substrate-binding protein
MDGGVYNVEYLKQQYDPITNEKLYEVIKYPNEDGTGMPYREIIKESTYNELSEEEKAQVRPYIE